MKYDFSVMYKDELVADVKLDTMDADSTSIKRYILGPKQPFMCNREDVPYIYDFLESRCFENGRVDLPEILKAHNMTDNNPYIWCRKTHGVKYSDYWWIKFPGEELEWKDVSVR